MQITDHNLIMLTIPDMESKHGLQSMHCNEWGSKQRTGVQALGTTCPGYD